MRVIVNNSKGNQKYNERIKSYGDERRECEGR
jgi:hypothetical protein